MFSTTGANNQGLNKINSMTDLMNSGKLTTTIIENQPPTTYQSHEPSPEPEKQPRPLSNYRTTAAPLLTEEIIHKAFKTFDKLLRESDITPDQIANLKLALANIDKKLFINGFQSNSNFDTTLLSTACQYNRNLAKNTIFEELNISRDNTLPLYMAIKVYDSNIVRYLLHSVYVETPSPFDSSDTFASSALQDTPPCKRPAYPFDGNQAAQSNPIPPMASHNGVPLLQQAIDTLKNNMEKLCHWEKPTFYHPDSAVEQYNVINCLITEIDTRKGGKTYLKKILKTEDKQLLLSISASKGFSALARILLECGANPNPADAYELPLHAAAKEGNSETMQELITKGAVLNATDKYGRRALDAAINNNQNEAIMVLLGNGAEVHYYTKKGDTPLTVLAQQGNTDGLNVLINAQFSTEKCPITRSKATNIANLVNQTDQYGNTPLHIAVTHGYDHFVQVLLSTGANPFARDRNGRTFIDVASSKGHLDIANLLINSITNPDEATSAYLKHTHESIEQKSIVLAIKTGTLEEVYSCLNRLHIPVTLEHSFW